MLTLASRRHRFRPSIEALKDSQAPDVHVLFVQPPDTAAGDAVGEVCRTAGMAELGRNHLISAYLLREATTRGIARQSV